MTWAKNKLIFLLLLLRARFDLAWDIMASTNENRSASQAPLTLLYYTFSYFNVAVVKHLPLSVHPAAKKRQLDPALLLFFCLSIGWYWYLLQMLVVMFVVSRDRFGQRWIEPKQREIGSKKKIRSIRWLRTFSFEICSYIKYEGFFFENVFLRNWIALKSHVFRLYLMLCVLVWSHHMLRSNQPSP